MKTNLLLVLSIFLFGISHAQENCQNFRTGNFQNMENGILKATIQRNDSIQREQYGEKEVKLRIDWIDECSYRLKFLEGNEAFWNSRPKGMSTPDLIVRIIDVNGNKSIQESKFDIDGDFVYRSEIIKVE